MAKEEPIGWITLNGNHIPLYQGDSKAEAIQRFINAKVKNESETKEKQIEQAKEEADKLNEQQPATPPRRLNINNIKAEDANKTTDVLHLGSRRRYVFKAGTEIENAYVFAGAGCSKDFRDAAKYAGRYGGKAEDWQHCAGWGVITNGEVTMRREIHWVQGKDGKVREAFIKVRH